MLPPVIAVPSSQISYQEQRPFIEIAGSAPLNAPLPQAVVPSALEQSVVAGRLNILLLTGRERMAENLALLAEMFGTAIGVTRKEGESSLAFATRLAEAIAGLPLSQRVKLEGQLARALSGANLRMLLASLKNPAGADAAKLSILIELARAKERDLAARSVVTSYRQNAAEPRGEAGDSSRSHRAAESALAAVTAEPAAEAELAAEAQAAATETPAVQKADEATPADEQPAPALQADTPDSKGANDVLAADGRDSEAVVAGEPEQQQPEHGDDSTPSPVSTPADTETFMIALAAESRSSEHGDAQGLQALLLRSFASEAAALESHGPAVTAPQSNAPVAGHSEQSADADAAARAQNDAPRVPMDEYTPGIELRRAPDNVTEERPRTTLLVLKGWREVDNLVPILLDEAAEGKGRALVAQAMQAARGSLPDEHEENMVDPQLLPEELRQAKRQGAPLDLAGSELAENSSKDGTSLRSFAEVLLSQWRILDEHMTTLRPAAEAPEGTPFPVVNYLFADDEEAGKSAEETKQRHGDGRDGQAEQQASGENERGGEEQAEGEQEPEVEDGGAMQGDPLLVQPRDTTGLAADAERANDLYWRMAGWS